MGCADQFGELLGGVDPYPLLSRLVLVFLPQQSGAGTQRPVRQQFQRSQAVPVVALARAVALAQKSVQLVQGGQNALLYHPQRHFAFVLQLVVGLHHHLVIAAGDGFKILAAHKGESPAGGVLHGQKQPVLYLLQTGGRAVLLQQLNGVFLENAVGTAVLSNFKFSQRGLGRLGGDA